MGWVCGGSRAGAAGFCGPSMWEGVFCISVVVVQGACVRDCKGLGLCKV
jgi:hypothetical protein